MKKLALALALVGSFALTFTATAFPTHASAEPTAGGCKDSGASCKFGSECCSKICKASYTCK